MRILSGCVMPLPVHVSEGGGDGTITMVWICLKMPDGLNQVENEKLQVVKQDGH